MEQLTRLAAQMQSRTSDLMNTEVSASWMPSQMENITDSGRRKIACAAYESNGKKDIHGSKEAVGLWNRFIL